MRHRLILRSRALLATALLAASFLPATPAGAQGFCRAVEEGCPDYGYQASSLGQEVTTAGINAVLGGLTTGTLAALRGQRFVDGFFSGAAGGALVYAGKRVAVERFDGAGLIGRQVGSVGGSLIRSGVNGNGGFGELVLPLGPLRLYLAAGQAPQLRLDLAATTTAAVFALRDGADLDLDASLSAGALTFRDDDGRPGGMHAAGVLLVRGGLEAFPDVWAHERVHALQYDQSFLSWGEPVERWLVRSAGVPASVSRWVDLGLVAPVEGLVNEAIAYGDRPWEREAYFLEGLGEPVPDPRDRPRLF